MHALRGGQVERTLSAVRRYRTGLPGAETHERRGQNVGDFVEPFGGRHAVGVKRVHRPIAGNAIEDAEEAKLRKEIRWTRARLRRFARVPTRRRRRVNYPGACRDDAGSSDSGLDSGKEHN